MKSDSRSRNKREVSVGKGRAFQNLMFVNIRIPMFSVIDLQNKTFFCPVFVVYKPFLHGLNIFQNTY